MHTSTSKKNSGFTLVELLIVVVLIGILSGIVISVIDPVRQRQKAETATRIATIEKLVTGLEAYYGAEGVYPTTATAGNPLPDTPTLANIISAWPDGYYYSYDATTQQFCISTTMVEEPVSPETYLKYISLDPANPGAECTGQLLIDCPSEMACHQDPDHNTGCVTLQDVVCP